MTEALNLAAAPEAATATPDTVLVREYPGIEGARSLDCATIPADVRLHLLKDAAGKYIANNVNQAVQRHNKDELVAAWAAYEAATAADPLQTAVAKPDKDKPAAPDLVAVYEAAVQRLVNGEYGKRGTGEGRTRAPKDPLVAAVTTVVERDVFTAKKAEDSKYTFIKARTEVGGDGIAYLKARIDEKVAAGADRAALEKMLEDRYLKPARIMLGIDTPKAIKEGVGIL